MAAEDGHSDATLATAIHAAAEGAAAGTATWAAALGELRGQVIARLDEGNRRMGDMHGDLRTMAGTMDEVKRRQDVHEQRLGNLEAGRKSVSTWIRESLGWLVGAGSLIYVAFHH